MPETRRTPAEVMRALGDAAELRDDARDKWDRYNAQVLALLQELAPAFKPGDRSSVKCGTYYEEKFVVVRCTLAGMEAEFFDAKNSRDLQFSESPTSIKEPSDSEPARPSIRSDEFVAGDF